MLAYSAIAGAPIAAAYAVSASSPQVPPDVQGATIVVPASRTAKFAGRSRVIVFTGTKPVIVPKGPLDELYYVGDFSKDLLEASTTAVSVDSTVVGVPVLEGPNLQLGYGVVKLGALDMTPGAKNLFTFRVTCANGEQLDRTIELVAFDDRSKVFGKDPDDKRFYTFDLSADATFGGTVLASIQPPVIAGVTGLAAPVIQGNLVTLKFGGLDIADGAVNSCTLTASFANTEKIVRAIYFNREEH